MQRSYSLLALLLALALPPAACQGPRTTRPEQVRPSRHAALEPALDAEHYRLALSIDPAGRSIEGTCTIRMSVKSAGMRRVDLDLIGMEVTDVVTPRGHHLPFRQDDKKLHVDLVEDVDVGDSVELEIAYGGRPERGLWFAGDDEGAPTHVFTQGECEDSRRWFPCIDIPADRATSEVIVTMPQTWRSVAAGDLVGSSESGGRRTEHWRMTTPHPAYLTTLVAGDFVWQEGEWEGVPLWFVAPEEYAGWLPDSFEETDEILTCFSELTGLRYPYSKYSQACVENFPFGGMENISATTMTCETLTDARGHLDGGSWGLVAHEAAHQWFGDLLTCETWPHIWLNEGFATYFTLLYAEESRGVDDFRVRMRDTQERYLEADVGANRRPTVWDRYVDPMDLFFGGQAYSGGASRLHLLRFVLGDEAFFGGIRRYVALHTNSSVTTDEFRQAMEEASGQDLEAFFQQWFHQAGYPELRVAWSWDERDAVVHLKVEQTQSTRNWTPEVFEVPVDVEVRTEAGPTLHRIELSARSEVFELACDEEPRWVRFDKNGWVPKRLESFKTLNEWLVLAKEDEDVNGRRDALVALGKKLGDAQWALEALLLSELQEVLEQDPVPAVRASAALALSGSSAHAVRVALERAASGDGSAVVRIAALNALRGGEGDPAQIRFADAAFDEAFSWETAAAAARLRVSLSEDGVAWIEEALRRESPHDTLRASLFELLAEQDDLRVVGILRAWVSDESVSAKARGSAAEALAVVSRDDPETSALLASFMEDAPYRLQYAAVNGLASSRERTARRVLAKSYPSMTDPRQRRVVEAAFREAD